MYVSMLNASRLSKIVFHFLHCMIPFPWVQNICLEIQISMMMNVVSCLGEILDISNAVSNSADRLFLKQT